MIRVWGLRSIFSKGRDEALVIEAQTGCNAARLEVPVTSVIMDPNLVLLGEDALVAALVRLGFDARMRHVALSLFTPQLVLALGGRGWGKSHLGRLIAEALHLYFPGVNSLPRPLRSVTFEIEQHLGKGRRQMLRGFFPNGNAAQLQQLHDYYNCRVSNAAFRYGLVRCLPESLPQSLPRQALLRSPAQRACLQAGVLLSARCGPLRPARPCAPAPRVAGSLPQRSNARRRSTVLPPQPAVQRRCGTAPPLRPAVAPAAQGSRRRWRFDRPCWRCAVWPRRAATPSC
jgi:hypothetical protein